MAKLLIIFIYLILYTEINQRVSKKLIFLWKTLLFFKKESWCHKIAAYIIQEKKILTRLRFHSSLFFIFTVHIEEPLYRKTKHMNILIELCICFKSLLILNSFEIMISFLDGCASIRSLTQWVQRPKTFKNSANPQA